MQTNLNVDIKPSAYKLISLRIYLFLAYLEGLGTIAALFSIPSDSKNTGLLGYSLNRWILIMFAAAITALCAYALVGLLRNANKPNRLFRAADIIPSQPRYWFTALFLFLSLFILGLTIFFISLINPFSVYYLRIVPLLIWLTIFSLQTIFIIIYLVFKELHPNAKPDHARNTARVMVYLFLLSLAIRLIFAIPVITNGTPTAFDEAGYFEMITGYQGILKSVASGQVPSQLSIDYAYNEGRWPPLHPLILAVSSLLFGGEDLTTSRLTVLLFSALTTPLVFLLTTKIFSEKPGRAAALIHIFYPSFIAFSHYLWSESIYIFLLLLTLYLVILASDSQNDHKRLFFSALVGILLGLSGLVRTTTLPFLIVLPLWFFLTSQGRKYRVRIPITIITFSLLIWIPWLSFLQLNEGRVLPLAATSGYNLYLGNNPWGVEVNRALVTSTMDQYAHFNFIDRDMAARILALEEIQSDPPGFVQRSFIRLSRLWSSDSFLMRHIFNLVYAPIPPSATLWVWAMVVSSYIVVLLLMIWGLTIASSNRNFILLILMLVISGMLLPAISVVNTRLHLPLLAMLLPLAGMGAANFKVKRSKPQLAFFSIGAVTIVFLVVANFPYNLRYVRASSYYQDPLHTINALFNIDLSFKDTVAFDSKSNLSDTITISILTARYYFEDSNQTSMLWEITGDQDVLVLVFESDDPSRPLTLKLYSSALDRSTIIYPFVETNWRTWHTIEIDQIEYSWQGGD